MENNNPVTIQNRPLTAQDKLILRWALVVVVLILAVVAWIYRPVPTCDVCWKPLNNGQSHRHPFAAY